MRIACWIPKDRHTHSESVINKIFHVGKPHVFGVQLKSDGTQCRTGGKVKGKLANRWVASTLHTTSEHVVSSITTADAHTSAASSRLN